MTIVEILDELNVPYRRAGESHHVTQGWIGVDCPQCSPGQGRFKLGIPVNGFHASCWTCGTVNLVEVLTIITGINHGKIRSLLGGMERPATRTEPVKRGRLVAPKGVGPLLRPHVEYLRRRKFDPDKIAGFWGLRGIGVHPSLAWRIFIPVDLDGITVSWTTRAIDDDAPAKYKAAPAEAEAVSAKHLLYGSDHARHAVIVTEGVFDVFRIGPGAVATLGIAYTKSQVAKISKYPVRVICYDSEPAAQAKARELCRTLEALPGKTVRVELDAPDPGSASPKEVKRLRKEFLE